MNNYLPEDNKISISSLGRLFDNMSECYKLFWFQAIVNIVTEPERRDGREELLLCYNDIINTGNYQQAVSLTGAKT